MNIQNLLYFCLILVGLSSCLGDVGFDPIENSSIDVEGCDFYGVMNDSIWCGMSSYAVLSDEELILEFDKDGPLVGGYASEKIQIYLSSYIGEETYYLEEGDLYIVRQDSYDTFISLYELDPDGGEVSITNFDENTKEIQGAIRFNVSGVGSITDKRRLTGGRFKAILEQ